LGSSGFSDFTYSTLAYTYLTLHVYPSSNRDRMSFMIDGESDLCQTAAFSDGAFTHLCNASAGQDGPLQLVPERQVLLVSIVMEGVVFACCLAHLVSLPVVAPAQEGVEPHECDAEHEADNSGCGRLRQRQPSRPQAKQTFETGREPWCLARVVCQWRTDLSETGEVSNAYPAEGSERTRNQSRTWH
jgi:hypothetical protein